MFAELKTQLVQNYGVQILLTLDNFEKAGLFRRQEVQSIAQAASVGFSGWTGGQMAKLQAGLENVQVGFLKFQ